MDNKKTALNSLHRKYGAKLVSFAGYEMPIQYSNGIIEEHKNTRENAGIFDVSHMGQLFIKGDEALAKDLEGIFPTELSNAKLNQSKYSFLMNEDAGIYDDLIITKIEEGYLIILNAACKDKDFEILFNLLGTKFKMNLDNNRSLIAIKGPKSVEILNSIINGVDQLNFMTGNWFDFDNQKLFVTRSGYTGEDGFEISMPGDQAERIAKLLISDQAVEWVGLGARDSLRLEAGLSLYGHELDEQHSPVESSLTWALSKTRRHGGERPGGYPGDAIVMSHLSEGTKVKIVGLQPEGRVPVRDGALIEDGAGNRAGQVTSGGFGPSAGKPVAIARIEVSCIDDRSNLFALVRDKKIPVSVVKLPFVKQNYFRG
jgi:aminomethyltransferase